MGFVSPSSQGYLPEIGINLIRVYGELLSYDTHSHTCTHQVELVSAENVIRKGEMLQACSDFKVVIALQCYLCVCMVRGGR